MLCSQIHNLLDNFMQMMVGTTLYDIKGAISEGECRMPFRNQIIYMNATFQVFLTFLLSSPIRE